MSYRDVPSTSGTERRPLMLALRVPRNYGSLFPYYKFVRDTVNDTMITEVICEYVHEPVFMDGVPFWYWFPYCSAYIFILFIAN